MINSKSIRTILFSILSLSIFVLVFFLILSLSKPVTIIVDGIEMPTYTFKNTVEDILEENNIVLKDGSYVSPSKFSKISGLEKIVLINPVPVIFYRGTDAPYEVMTTSDNVMDFLKEQGIDIDGNDIVIPSIDTEIVPDLEIQVKYVDLDIREQSFEIDYEVIIKYNDNFYEDEEKVIQDGKKGLRLVKNEITYENGVEINNKIVYDNVEVNPVEKIIERGTKKREIIGNTQNAQNYIDFAYKSGKKISFLGKEYLVSKTLSVEATAFYNSGSNGNHTTATGNPTVYNPFGWSTIAVDPNVIPLNTKIYVEGYGFGIAHDTGGLIKGNIIDVFMPNKSLTYKWGRKKNVKIYILN